jgi:hypothetical protein
MSVSRTSLTRKRSSAQDLGQARPGTAEKYRNRDGNQQTSADFDGRTASLRTRVSNVDSISLQDGMQKVRRFECLSFESLSFTLRSGQRL